MKPSKTRLLLIALSALVPATLVLAGLTGHAQSNGPATPNHASNLITTN